MKRPVALVLFAGVLLLAGAACKPRADGAAPAAMIADGKAIVDAQCSSCHATGATGDSPRSDAPPLRTVLSRYDANALSDAFISGIKVGHPDMPEFELTPDGADRLLAYLKSIQTPPEGN